MATDDDKGREDIARWLAELRIEHRDLDEVIEYLEQTGHPDRMKILRMKKRKLKLKDTSPGSRANSSGPRCLTQRLT